jgi:hypothetical protein
MRECPSGLVQTSRWVKLVDGEIGVVLIRSHYIVDEVVLNGVGSTHSQPPLPSNS